MASNRQLYIVPSRSHLEATRKEEMDTMSVQLDCWPSGEVQYTTGEWDSQLKWDNTNNFWYGGYMCHIWS